MAQRSAPTPSGPLRGAPRWSGPYILRRQLIASGLASRTTLAREHERGALVPFGRRGGHGPVVYRVEDVERWLAGDVPGASNDAAAVAARQPAVQRRRPADAGNADAIARIDAIARGGRR